jgi:hypothetical protein
MMKAGMTDPDLCRDPAETGLAGKPFGPAMAGAALTPCQLLRKSFIHLTNLTF